MQIKFLLLSSIIIIASCSSSEKIVKFPASDDIYANAKLKEFFKNNKNPSIVLRTPNKDNATSNTKTKTNLNILYNAIEKEFL